MNNNSRGGLLFQIEEPSSSTFYGLSRTNPPIYCKALDVERELLNFVVKKQRPLGETCIPTPEP